MGIRFRTGRPRAFAANAAVLWCVLALSAMCLSVAAPMVHAITAARVVCTDRSPAAQPDPAERPAAPCAPDRPDHDPTSCMTCAVIAQSRDTMIGVSAEPATALRAVIASVAPGRAVPASPGVRAARARDPPRSC